MLLCGSLQRFWWCRMTNYWIYQLPRISQTPNNSWVDCNIMKGMWNQIFKSWISTVFVAWVQGLVQNIIYILHIARWILTWKSPVKLAHFEAVTAGEWWASTEGSSFLIASLLPLTGLLWKASMLWRYQPSYYITNKVFNFILNTSS